MPKLVLINLIKVVEREKNNANQSTWIKHVLNFKKSCIPRLSFDDIPLKPQQVIKELSEAIN